MFSMPPYLDDVPVRLHVEFLHVGNVGDVAVHADARVFVHNVVPQFETESYVINR